VDTEKAYPYIDADSKKCKFQSSGVAATMSAMGICCGAMRSMLTPLQ